MECLKCKVPDFDVSVSINTIIQQLNSGYSFVNYIVCVFEICWQSLTHTADDAHEACSDEKWIKDTGENNNIFVTNELPLEVHCCNATNNSIFIATISPYL